MTSMLRCDICEIYLSSGLGSKMEKIAETTLILRLPKAMKEWLRDRATLNDRNMTAELKQIIKAAMENDPKPEAEHAR